MPSDAWQGLLLLARATLADADLPDLLIVDERGNLDGITSKLASLMPRSMIASSSLNISVPACLGFWREEECHYISVIAIDFGRY